MKRLLLLVIICAAGCTGALNGGTISIHDIIHPPEQQPFVYDGHVKTFAGWQDHATETAAFTTAISISVDCDDPNGVAKADAILANDSRQILWGSPVTGWGTEGYILRDDAESCWQPTRDLIRKYRSRSLAVQGPDEPPDVAWSYWVDGGTRYEPNRYNAMIAAAAALVHRDVPGLPVLQTYGSLPDGLVIADGVDLVGVETYDANWAQQIQRLETLTASPVWMLPPAWVDGDPKVLDPIVAQRVRNEWLWAQHDTRVTGLLFFLWCITQSTDCNDLTTGDKSSYTVGGGSLPLTQEAVIEVGTQIRGH